MKPITSFINEKLKITKDVQDNVSNFLDGFDASSIQYWKNDIGLDPTQIDYTQNKRAEEIILRFGKANKIDQLFDYLAAGCPNFENNSRGKQEWLNYVATIDINDFEQYNGKIEEKLKITLNGVNITAQEIWDTIRNYQNTNDKILKSTNVYDDNIPCEITFNDDSNIQKHIKTDFAIKAYRTRNGDTFVISTQLDTKDEHYMYDIAKVKATDNDISDAIENVFNGYNAFEDFYNFCKTDKPIISEKLKIGKNQLENIFNSIEPDNSCNKEEFKNAAKTLGSNVYDLSRIYGKDLPTLWRSDNFEDKNAIVYNLLSYVNRDFSIYFKTDKSEEKPYTEFYDYMERIPLLKTLGKGNIDKGWAIIKYIINDL